MSDFLDEDAAIQGGPINTESMDDLERRHKAEVRKLEGEVRALLKTAKKSTKAQIETQAIRMQYDLKDRHQQELEELENRAEEPSGTTTATPPQPREPGDTVDEDNSAVMTEDEIASAKRAKAKKKQDKKKAKDQELVNAKLQIEAENSGPSARDIELAKINAKLVSESVEVKPILSDGNCLYRAIADQLAFTSSSKKEDHHSLRGLAAAHIRSHAEDYSPFLGLEAGGREFEEYCDKVASLTDAEWGGQLEVKALSAVLNVPIQIYAADGPVIIMNDAGTTSSHPLRITYHKKYFALGEHYNSVTALPVA